MNRLITPLHVLTNDIVATATIYPSQGFQDIAAAKNSGTVAMAALRLGPDFMKLDTLVRGRHDNTAFFGCPRAGRPSLCASLRAMTRSGFIRSSRIWNRIQSSQVSFPGDGSNLLAVWPRKDRNTNSMLGRGVSKGSGNLPTRGRPDQRRDLCRNMDLCQRRP